MKKEWCVSKTMDTKYINGLFFPSQIAEVEAEIEKSENVLDSIKRRLGLNVLTESDRFVLRTQFKLIYEKELKVQLCTTCANKCL